METRACQNCKNDFTIAPEDFEFYEKIKVPPPTWCSRCRLQRRLSWRNERVLSKITCAFCGTEVISMYRGEQGAKNIYCSKCWWSDSWDDLASGAVLDLGKNFFEQFKNVLERAPLPSLINVNPVESAFVNFTTNSKNCYLLFSSGAAAPNENCLYSYRLDGCKDCAETNFGYANELCFELSNGVSCNNVQHSHAVENTFDSQFLFDAKNCSSCFGATNVRNKQYVLWNENLSEKEYKEKLAAMPVGSYAYLMECKERFKEITEKAIHRYAILTNSVNCTGQDVHNSKNCKYCFYVMKSENSKYIIDSPAGTCESYDVSQGGGDLLYECLTAVSGCSNIKCSLISSHCADLQYSYWNINCSSLFGCVGLRNKSYCILNRQYKKDEYERLVPKVIELMNSIPYVDSGGREYRYGEFPPAEFSPHAYNETLAQQYFPLAKKEVLESGYAWRDPDVKNYILTISSSEIPDNIADVSDSITREIIACEHADSGCNEMCTTAFRIIPSELALYRKKTIPLPRFCPNCRHAERLKSRNPFNLWHRQCMRPGCKNEFETSYALERPEIVYCQSCYQQEVV